MGIIFYLWCGRKRETDSRRCRLFHACHSSEPLLYFTRLGSRILVWQSQGGTHCYLFGLSVCQSCFRKGKRPGCDSCHPRAGPLNPILASLMASVGPHSWKASSALPCVPLKSVIFRNTQDSLQLSLRCSF